MVCIIRFPGTNCETDTQYAFSKLGIKTKIIWHQETTLPKNTSLVILPGGFSFGDYLRSGAIAKVSPILDSVIKFASNNGRILGICNGFQILTETKLLSGALVKNKNMHFISKFHYIKVQNNDNVFLSNYNKNDTLNIPIAHGDGNYVCDDDELKRIYDNNQVLFTYCDKSGNTINPNGSIDAIAGICNKNKNIFGLMPHPERAIEDILGSKDGLKMLENLVS
ncbi:Phosphoribosylformylglycinamidine synthase, glutamine amidotransferase subunit [hydrothermal vent metagenome]|uniref:Phosphoribosylformylglycinamidine synthase, glutamine amidotransferase subunit n=1 Tax=hydrothermal vent metagenome TaxID=652676 RepID=A0A3B1E6W2_9ZZZZ